MEEQEGINGTSESQPNNQPECNDTGERNESGVESEGEQIIEPHYQFIPRKFKTYQDLAKWGSEAEKQKSKVENERGKLSQQLESAQSQIAQLQEELQKRSTTPERKEEIKEEIDDLGADFDNLLIDNPRKAINMALEKKMQKFKQEFENKSLKEKENIQNAQEVKKLIEDYGEDKLREMYPELAKIKKEKPYLDLEGIIAVYEKRQNAQLDLNEQSKKMATDEKKKAVVESNKGASYNESKSIIDKINSAKSSKELESLREQVIRESNR